MWKMKQKLGLHTGYSELKFGGSFCFFTLWCLASPSSLLHSERKVVSNSLPDQMTAGHVGRLKNLMEDQPV